VDALTKIIEKSGGYDVIFLIGKVFNKQNTLKDILILEKINSFFIIFDNTEIGRIIKHLNSNPFNFTENILFLDRSGIITVKGLKIAYLSGYENENYLLENSNNIFSSDYCQTIFTGEFFNREDVNKLIKIDNQIDKIDIFVSHTIPNIIFQELINSRESPLFYSLNNLHADDTILTKKISKDEIEKCSSYVCSLISKILKPRYHLICVEDFFYEKLNYYKEENKNHLLSRFINLAYVNFY